MRRLLTIVMLLAVLLGPVAIAAACPTCKDTIAENDPNHQNLVKGYYYSILFMMSMPYLLLGTFGSCAYISVRRARARIAAEHQDAEQQDTASAAE